MSAFMTANSVFSAPKPLEVEYDTEYYKELKKVYKGVTTDESVIDALEILKNTHGVYSYKAIMGENLTGKKIKIEMKDLSEISPNYRDFDALGWKKNERLFIYVNKNIFTNTTYAKELYRLIHENDSAGILNYMKVYLPKYYLVTLSEEELERARNIMASDKDTIFGNENDFSEYINANPEKYKEIDAAHELTQGGSIIIPAEDNVGTY